MTNMQQKLDYNLNWSEYFRIDESSPSNLIRIKNRVGKDISGYYVGYQKFDKNGKPDNWRLGFRGKDYLIHRIVWVLTYGSIDSDLVIDHLDGNPFNNKIENLSLKTTADNLRNQRMRRNNKTGVTGVIFMQKDACNFYYAAHWCEINGKRKSKLFSVAKLGEETAKALAIAYREEQIIRLILEGADYTERHGI